MHNRQCQRTFQRCGNFHGTLAIHSTEGFNGQCLAVKRILSHNSPGQPRLSGGYAAAGRRSTNATARQCHTKGTILDFHFGDGKIGAGGLLQQPGGNAETGGIVLHQTADAVDMANAGVTNNAHTAMRAGR